MTTKVAAHTVALQVVVFAHKHQQPFTLMNVQEHMSEMAAGHHGPYLAQAAKDANYKTAYKVACKMAHEQGEDHLVA